MNMKKYLKLEGKIYFEYYTNTISGVNNARLPITHQVQLGPQLDHNNSRFVLLK